MSNKNNVEQLYAEHRKPLERYIGHKMRQSAEAEDVVQETFTRLLNEDAAAARGLLEADSPVAYLYRVAGNLAIDRLRQLKSRVDEGERGQVDDSLEDRRPDPADHLAASERLAQLKEAVGRLPLKRRQVFVLHKYRQMTYREVAEHLGISVSMVEKHMTKALAQLDMALKGNDDER